MLAKPLYVSKRPRIEMVPLIDTFFLLLIFFIFGIFSMRMQQGIVVDLPQAATATFEPEESLAVSVTAAGELFVNQRPVTVETLGVLLRAEASRRPETLVVLNADRLAQHGLVVSVLDAVRAAGLQRVSLQTAPGATS